MANTAVIDNLRRNIQMVGQAAIAKKMKDQERKKEFSDTIKKSLVTGAMSGRVRPKAGASFEGLDIDNPDFGAVLGQIGGMYEPQPAKVSTSVSQTSVPFSDILTARGVLGATPEDLAKKGLATEEPRNILRKIGDFFTGGKPTYTPTEGYNAMKADAEALLANPNRTTTRVTNGQVLGMGGTQSESEMPDASQYEEGTTAEDDNGQKWVVQGGEWVQA